MRSKKDSEEGGQSLRRYEMVALPASQAGRRKPKLQMVDEGRLWKCSPGRIEGAGSGREQDEESGSMIANETRIGHNCTIDVCLDWFAVFKIKM